MTSLHEIILSCLLSTLTSESSQRLHNIFAGSAQSETVQLNEWRWALILKINLKLNDK